MKLKKLLKRISTLIDTEQSEQLQQCELLKKTLKKLKQKHRELKKKLEHEKDKDKRRELEEKIQIVKAQRRKGLGLLKSLQKSAGAGNC